MGYVVYANWVGIHRWGMAGHKEIAALRRYVFSGWGLLGKLLGVG